MIAYRPAHKKHRHISKEKLHAEIESELAQYESLKEQARLRKLWQVIKKGGE
jgi:hypothetical protein